MTNYTDAVSELSFYVAACWPYDKFICALAERDTTHAYPVSLSDWLGGEKNNALRSF